MIALLAVAAAVLPGHRDDGCQTRACAARVERREWLQVVRPYVPWLLSTAECESGRRWHIATGNGFYGGLQFTIGSWQAVGGRGMPHLATALEQMFRAVKLRRAQGPGAWPVCGH